MAAGAGAGGAAGGRGAPPAVALGVRVVIRPSRDDWPPVAGVWGALVVGGKLSRAGVELFRTGTMEEVGWGGRGCPEGVP